MVLFCGKEARETRTIKCSSVAAKGGASLLAYTLYKYKEIPGFAAGDFCVWFLRADRSLFLFLGQHGTNLGQNDDHTHDGDDAGGQEHAVDTHLNRIGGNAGSGVHAVDCAVDDAYVYMYEEDRYMLVVNASNTDKDLAHFATILPQYDCTVTNMTDKCASIAVQGPDTDKILSTLIGGPVPVGPKKNDLGFAMMEGRKVWLSRTGYTGEPIGYELFIESEELMDAAAYEAFCAEEG